MCSRSRLRRSIFASSSPNSCAENSPRSIAASIWLSMMCVSSPSRIAPAIRALPLSVCRPRRSESEMFWSEGFAFQSRRSLPMCGTRVSASSRKIGSSCWSMSSFITRSSLLLLTSTGGACRRAVSSCRARAASMAGAGAWRCARAATISRSLATASLTGSTSRGTLTWLATGVQCSSAAARSATAPNPAVRELLASVCAARANSSEASDCASSVWTCCSASLA